MAPFQDSLSPSPLRGDTRSVGKWDDIRSRLGNVVISFDVAPRKNTRGMGDSVCKIANPFKTPLGPSEIEADPERRKEKDRRKGIEFASGAGRFMTPRNEVELYKNKREP